MWDLVLRSGQNNDTDCATQVAPAGWRCDSGPRSQVPASLEWAEVGRLSRLLSPEQVYKKREVGLVAEKAAWSGEGAGGKAGVDLAPAWRPWARRGSLSIVWEFQGGLSKESALVICILVKSS